LLQDYDTADGPPGEAPRPRRQRPGRAHGGRRLGAALRESRLKHASFLDRAVRVLVNLAGAAGAAFFARSSLLFYLQTHRLIGAVFFIEQAWFVAAAR
jgi:hypothetical protein